MKRLLSVALFTNILFIQLAVAQSQPLAQSPNGASSTTSSHTAQQPKPNCSENGTYVNSKGETVKGPRIVRWHPRVQPRNVGMAHTASAEVGAVHVCITEVSRNGFESVLRELPICLSSAL